MALALQFVKNHLILPTKLTKFDLIVLIGYSQKDNLKFSVATFSHTSVGMHD